MLVVFNPRKEWHMENKETNLKVIENNLVPVYETDKGEKVVYGTDLHRALEVKSNYRDWVRNRLNDCDAVENEDYESFAKNLAKPSGGRPSMDHILKLDIAKEMAMLERNEKGKQVRRYFIAVEKKYKKQQLDLSQLSPQLQMFGSLFQAIAQQEIIQKQQAEQIQQLDNRISSIREVISLSSKDWRKGSGIIITKIAVKMGGYDHIRVAREESYRILEQRMGVSLKTRLLNKKKNMILNGANKSRIDNLNQLDVIEDDRKLIEGYVAIIKEMAIKYGVDVA